MNQILVAFINTKPTTTNTKSKKDFWEDNENDCKFNFMKFKRNFKPIKIKKIIPKALGLVNFVFSLHSELLKKSTFLIYFSYKIYFNWKIKLNK